MFFFFPSVRGVVRSGRRPRPCWAPIIIIIFLVRCLDGRRTEPSVQTSSEPDRRPTFLRVFGVAGRGRPLFVQSRTRHRGEARGVDRSIFGYYFGRSGLLQEIIVARLAVVVPGVVEVVVLVRGQDGYVRGHVGDWIGVGLPGYEWNYTLRVAPWFVLRKMTGLFF